MEDKSLNFNQPFLSVRRRTPTSSSEPRDERKRNVSRPAIPRLPPHRSELISGPIRSPGSVPFIWEQTPGQPKEEPKARSQNYDRLPIAPKLPPGRYPKPDLKDCDKPSPSNIVGMNQAINVPPPSIVVDTNQISYVPSSNDNKQETFDESVTNVEISKETAKGKESSDSGDSDTFVDALDTLSRAESSFLNCSIAGTKELDDLDVESSGIFVTDPQAQKLMMDRFLPAAKAMASDTIHCTPKTQRVVDEVPNQLNKGVNQFKPTLRYGPSFAKRYSEYRDVEEDKEDSEDDDDQRENMPGVCGLLPRFCLKGSIGRLNPVPGVSVRTRVPISPHVAQRRSASAGPYGETVNELRSNRNEMKSIERVQTAELIEGKAQCRNDYRQFASRATLTYRNASWSSLEAKQVASEPEEQTNDDNNDSGLYGKGFKTFREVLADRDTPKDSGSGSDVEKTLYVDKVQKLESPKLMSHSQDAHDMEKFLPTSKEDHKITTIRMDHIPTADSTAADFKKFQSASKCDDSNMPSSFEKPNGAYEMDVTNASTTTGAPEPVNEVADTSEKPSYDELLAPPPLPKSPSDSWLLRTLPCVSKNSPLHPHFGAAKNPQSYGSNAPANDVKWETIVKTAKSQHPRMHHSVGLLTTIPEA